MKENNCSKITKKQISVFMPLTHVTFSKRESERTHVQKKNASMIEFRQNAKTLKANSCFYTNCLI